MSTATLPGLDSPADESSSTAIGFDDATGWKFIGTGEECTFITYEWQKLRDHYARPTSRQSETVEQRFRRLAESWRSDVMFLSSIDEMTAHPDYRGIIALGDRAVPLLLQELAEAPDHWFAALKAITAIDPVPSTDRGKIGKMAEAWVQWGKGQGIIS